MITDPKFLSGEVQRVEDNLLEFAPARQFQDITIELPVTALTPFDVTHILHVNDGHKVRFEILQCSAPLFVWMDPEDTQSANNLKLRASQNGGTVRLRLSVDDSGAFEPVKSAPGAYTGITVPGGDSTNSAIRIGQVNPGLGYDNSPGIVFSPGGTSAGAGAREFTLTQSNDSTHGPGLMIGDPNNANDAAIFWFNYSTAVGAYVFVPGAVASSFLPFYLGASNRRWSNVYSERGDFSKSESDLNTVTVKVANSNSGANARATVALTNGGGDVTDGLVGVSGASYSGGTFLADQMFVNAGSTLSNGLMVRGVNGLHLAFPATQLASSDANTLDDYEEGTWTPVITGSTSASGQAYDLQVGRYVKVGKKVTISCSIQLNTVGSITGAVEISGLPFTSQNVSLAFQTCGMGQWTTATNWVNIYGLIIPNTTRITLRGANAAATTNSTSLVQADLGVSSGFVLSATYIAET